MTLATPIRCAPPRSGVLRSSVHVCFPRVPSPSYYIIYVTSHIIYSNHMKVTINVSYLVSIIGYDSSYTPIRCAPPLSHILPVQRPRVRSLRPIKKIPSPS